VASKYLAKTGSINTYSMLIKRHVNWAEHRWLTPIILATQEAEIGGLRFRASPGQIVSKTLSQKYPV
jgi:hypothetical protein